MKTTPKHTPGPWNPIQAPQDCGAGWWIQGPETNGCRDLARLSRNFSTEANARLIAAAPAMLEALRGTLGLAEAYYRTLPDDGAAQDHYMAEVIAPARAAIAAATGEK